MLFGGERKGERKVVEPNYFLSGFIKIQYFQNREKIGEKRRKMCIRQN